MRQGDHGTAKPCMEQHLQLVQAVKDSSAEVNAWMQLGHLANASEDFANAVECYEQAAGIAEAQGEMGMLKRINCHLGISRGNLSLDSHFEMLAAESAAR